MLVGLPELWNQLALGRNRSDALTILHEATQGQMRDIDRIVGNALRQAARRKLAQVDRALLEQVLERDQQPGWS